MDKICFLSIRWIQVLAWGDAVVCFAAYCVLGRKNWFYSYRKLGCSAFSKNLWQMFPLCVGESGFWSSNRGTFQNYIFKVFYYKLLLRGISATESTHSWYEPKIGNMFLSYLSCLFIIYLSWFRQVYFSFLFLQSFLNVSQTILSFY